MKGDFISGIKFEITINASPGEEISIGFDAQGRPWEEPPIYPRDNPNLLTYLAQRKLELFKDSVYFEMTLFVKPINNGWFYLGNPAFPIPLRCEISENGKLYSIYLDRTKTVMLYQCQVIPENKITFLGLDLSDCIQCRRANGEILGYVINSNDKGTKFLPEIFLPDKKTKIAHISNTLVKKRRLINTGYPDKLLIDLRTQRQIMAMEWAKINGCIFHRLLDNNLTPDNEELLTLAFVVRSVYYCIRNKSLYDEIA